MAKCNIADEVDAVYVIDDTADAVRVTVDVTIHIVNVAV